MTMPEKIERLQRERDDLRILIGVAIRLLSDARRDIYQTARVNQGNIDGVDPTFPNDPPCVEIIGRHFVHQRGVDESMRLIQRIKDFLAAAHDKTNEQPRPPATLARQACRGLTAGHGPRQ